MKIERTSLTFQDLDAGEVFSTSAGQICMKLIKKAGMPINAVNLGTHNLFEFRRAAEVQRYPDAVLSLDPSAATRDKQNNEEDARLVKARLDITQREFQRVLQEIFNWADPDTRPTDVSWATALTNIRAVANNALAKLQSEEE